MRISFDKSVWDTISPSAPHRASVDASATWSLTKPSPDLASVGKICPGGRILLAFALPEVRDYFVEGHDGEGAQVEADNATVATARRPRSPDPSPPMDLSEAIVGYENARERCAAAEEVLEKDFLRDIEMFAGDGKFQEAFAVVRSIPETAANTKFLAISTLRDYYPEFTQFDEKPASYDSARARSLVTFQRAKRAMDEAEAHMDALLMPRAREALAAGDVETLENFRSMIPHGRSYGRICYMISDLRKKTVDDESLGQEFTVRM